MKWLTELGLYYQSIGPAMATIGQIAVGTIRQRTAQGVDRMGQAFRPYTKEYAKRKKSTHVNLRGRNRRRRQRAMLDSFGVDEGSKARLIADTRGRGAKIRDAGTGQFAAVGTDLVLPIVFADPESARIGWAHEAGRSPRWKSIHRRQWMGLNDVEVQEAFRLFNTNLHVMRSTQENIKVEFTI